MNRTAVHTIRWGLGLAFLATGFWALVVASLL